MMKKNPFQPPWLKCFAAANWWQNYQPMTALWVALCLGSGWWISFGGRVREEMLADAKDWKGENKGKKNPTHIIFMEHFAVLLQNQFTLTAKRISCLSVQSDRDEALYLSVFVFVSVFADTHTHKRHGRPSTPHLWRWRRRSADTTLPCGCCSMRPSSTRNCGTSPLRRRQHTTLSDDTLMLPSNPVDNLNTEHCSAGLCHLAVRLGRGRAPLCLEFNPP